MLEALEATGIATWVRESPSIFAYTLVLSLHAIGLGMVAGINGLIALRILGFAPGIPLGSLRDFYGVIWFGFAINAVSGVLLFMAGATNMGTMGAFWLKLAFVFAGMIIAVRRKSGYLMNDAALASGRAPEGARKLAWAALVCWVFAIIVGRMTGYPELYRSWFA